MLEAWSTAGLPVGTESLDGLFNVPRSTDLVEPDILFYNVSSEWIATALDPVNDTLVVTAGTGVLPWGPRAVFFVPPYPNERPDLPSVAASDWMVGIAANDINETTGNLDGTGYILLNRTELLTGVLSYYEVNPQYWFPNGHADTVLSASTDDWFGGVAPSPGTGVAYWLRWSNAPPALPVYETGGPTMAAYSTSPPAAQPGTVDLLNTSEGDDGRVDSATWQFGLETMVFSTGTGCPTAQSCIDLVQVNTTTGDLRQDFAIGSSDYALFDPSVSSDVRGDLTMTVSVSSATIYPSILVLGQAWNEPNRTAQGELFPQNGTGVIASGCDSQDVCPFGWSTGASSGTGLSSAWTAAETVNRSGAWSTWVQPAATHNASLSLDVYPAQVDLGQSVDFSTSGVAGTSQLTDFRWAGLPTGCPNPELASFSCHPTEVGTYAVVVRANDSYPTVVVAESTLTVRPDPSVSVPVANRSGADVGQSRTFTVIARLGVPPYTYSWDGLSTESCANSTGPSISCVLPRSGVLSIAVSVTDQTGTADTSGPLAFAVSPALGLVSLEAGNYSAGQPLSPVTFVVTTDGGEGPLNYSWTGLPGPCTSSTGPRIVCAPSRAGSYNVTVQVQDANGGTVTSPPLPWYVYGSTGSPSRGLLGLPGDDGWFLLAGLTAVGVLGGLAMVSRPPERTPPPPPESEPSVTSDD